MSEKQDKTPAKEAEVLEKNSHENKYLGINSETLMRVFYSVIFLFIGWISLWVFGFVIIVQFGFLLITGQVNTNLKGFNTEVGVFLFDIIKYLSFQTEKKPFPFQAWSHVNENKNELNKENVVKASK